MLPLMTTSVEASPATDHMCAYQSSTDSNKDIQEEACVYYADSVQPKTSTQPYMSKDNFKEKNHWKQVAPLYMF